MPRLFNSSQKGGLTMTLKFGDDVTLVKKSPDGTITRVNAIVIASVVQQPGVHRSKALRTQSGVLPEGEYLDLAYPVMELAQTGVAPTTRDMDVLFRKTSATPPWKEGSWIGWELPIAQAALNKLTAEHAYWTEKAKEKEAAFQKRIDELENK